MSRIEVALIVILLVTLAAIAYAAWFLGTPQWAPLE